MRKFQSLSFLQHVGTLSTHANVVIKSFMRHCADPRINNYSTFWTRRRSERSIDRTSSTEWCLSMTYLFVETRETGDRYRILQLQLGPGQNRWNRTLTPQNKDHKVNGDRAARWRQRRLDNWTGLQTTTMAKKTKVREPDRVLTLGRPDLERCDNKVVSARYNPVTFLPVVRT
jgi:hypothetical protein